MMNTTHSVFVILNISCDIFSRS